MKLQIETVSAARAARAEIQNRRSRTKGRQGRRFRRLVGRLVQMEMAPAQEAGGWPSYRPGGRVWNSTAWAVMAVLSGKSITRRTASGYAGYEEWTTWRPDGTSETNCNGGIGPL